MSQYRPYPQYKDSGVAWLGKIPKEWNSIKFKHVFREKKKKTDLMLDCGSISFGEVVYKDNDKIPEETKAAYQEVLIGEFLVNPLNLNFDLKSLRTALSNINVVVSTGYIVLQSQNDMNKNYLRWLLYQFDIAHMKTLGAGVRQTVNFTDIGNEYFYMPSFKEQQSIVNFLDNATCKIDTLIQKQQNLIELLKEKRQTAVENIIMQDKIVSMRLGMVVDQIFRPVDRKMEEVYIALGLYNRGRGLFHKEPKEGSELGDSYFYWIQNGDLILSGQFAWEGSVALAGKSENNCIVSHRYPVLRGKENIINTEYLWAFLTTKIGDFILNENSVGSAGRNRPLNINTLMKEKIPVPSLDEQLKISKIVQVEKKIIDSVAKTIELLKERRTALISGVVTGKIDVKGIAS